MSDDQRKIGITQPRQLRYYEWSLATGWTMVIAVLLAINFYHEKSQALETARTQARSNYQRDVIYRHWNAENAAVYVPITKDTQPNPYLADLPERDVITTQGKKLTLINPSYMTRLVFEMAAQSYGVKGHLTSLNPIRPKNLPDVWETAALKAFSGGSQEVSSVEKMVDGSYLRLMKPLKTDKDCLKCHRKQGYQVGEIRGGLSVAVPMEPLWVIARQNNILNSASFIVLWSIGLTSIFVGATRLRRTIRERDVAEREIIDLNQVLLTRAKELEAANRELDAFCSTVSHDLRAPLVSIVGFCQRILKTPADNHLDTCERYTGIILESAHKMEKLITTLLKFARITRDELTRTSVDLHGIADEISKEIEMNEPRRRAIFTIAADMTVNGDEALLRVVMQNLLGNAWKYTSKCAETLIEVGVTERDGKTVYFVRDNGIGFDNSQSEKMFEAFQRFANADEFEGTGIGLATVKRIITRHGGQIACDGEVGKGATFYFSL
ncbi:MAG: DUF3365 domain-containing protein [Desulfuromonadaceae bacterium]|nr:DUF3365 domain-containing protein [Desulfuromonadaceae bacterium]MDD2849938.1 DUF3365 domain-containing protein [Desulfuromonadaceae bacterium]MDD4130883.1 DUF3365 domain-containing protein [Desulfuromonadaceae bacterium]